MDTVSMLNTMSFYCQPILPLVYDESMSYYETLCKVVSQLNNTGETVNKLNEGLTGEIADRQAADTALSARLSKIEETFTKVHTIVFENPGRIIGEAPTRKQLYDWVKRGDVICTLLKTSGSWRPNIYAVTCNYYADHLESELAFDCEIVVPIKTEYNEKNDTAISQKLVKLTMPAGELSEQWGYQEIEVKTLATSAEGIVNVNARHHHDDDITANVTPAEFLAMFVRFKEGKQIAVGVNARLMYDGKNYASGSAVVSTGDGSNGKVTIEFCDYAGVFTENNVKQLNTQRIFLVGQQATNAWAVETIDPKIFDFIRYEGFQFTRGAHDVIITNDESTPNAVYAQYHSDTSGKLYQNLPTRLIDSVDGAEYWNGTFDIYGGNHMTFTFVTSNYATASDKMLVRVIELSADVGTTEWKYGVKEFTLPLDTSDKVVTYTASKVGEGEYSAARHKTEYTVDFAEGVPAIIASIEAGNRVILRVDLKELGSESGTTPLYFASGYTRVDVFANAISYIFSGSISNGHYTLEVNSALSHATLTYYGEVLPVPNPDGSDNGKVPTVNGTAWELKALPTYANGNEVSY